MMNLWKNTIAENETVTKEKKVKRLVTEKIGEEDRYGRSLVIPCAVLVFLIAKLIGVKLKSKSLFLLFVS